MSTGLTAESSSSKRLESSHVCPLRLVKDRDKLRITLVGGLAAKESDPHLAYQAEPWPKLGFGLFYQTSKAERGANPEEGWNEEIERRMERERAKWGAS